MESSTDVPYHLLDTVTQDSYKVKISRYDLSKLGCVIFIGNQVNENTIGLASKNISKKVQFLKT